MNYEIQVPKDHYFNDEYDKKDRWISYWYQITEVLRKKPRRVLEVGIGNGLVSDYLRKQGVQVTTCDIDPALNPNAVASVTRLPFQDEQFDVVLCAEVLEHLPFSEFQHALMNLRRVTCSWLVLTLPVSSLTYFYFATKFIPYVPPKSLSFRVPFPRQHHFDGQHHWEIGKRGYSLPRIRAEIKKAGFDLERDYAPPENMYHQFFVLHKHTA